MTTPQRRRAQTEVDEGPRSQVDEAPEDGERADGPTSAPDGDTTAAGPEDTAATPVRTLSRLRERSEAFSALAQQLHLGPIFAGIGLIVFGLLLLGGTQVAWRGLLEAGLSAVGLGLIIGSRRAGSRRALILTGLVMAVVLLGVWRADVPLQGGMRFTTVTPATPQELTQPFRQTAGTLTIDLTHYRPVPGQTEKLQASIGVGRLVVDVPPFTALQGSAVVGGGQVSIGSADHNGVGLDVALSAPGVPALTPADLRVGLGTVEVQVGKSP